MDAGTRGRAWGASKLSSGVYNPSTQRPGWTVRGCAIVTGVDGAELTGVRAGVSGGVSTSGAGQRPFAGARIEGPFALQGFQVGMWSSRRHRCLAVLVLDDMLVVLVDVTQADDDSTPAKGPYRP